MITISLCMIVKNEEAVLARCLDTVADLVDEIVIVDTGSTDATKEIAAGYTEHIYDFAWIDDFSAARNFAFSKATKEYIYTADADEVIHEENRQKFLQLKENLLPEIEIVQMLYGNQLQFGTVYNFDEEYRPKLFKRLREFVWQEPIHEMVRLEPVIYDSDIVITHMPTTSHASRDLKNFRKQTGEGKKLSKRLQNMYAKELFLAGEAEDLALAGEYFVETAADPDRSTEEVMEACLVVAKAARLAGEEVKFFKYANKVLVSGGNSEICMEMGLFYEEHSDLEEAIIWYYNAVYETQPILSLESGRRHGLEGLIRCYEKLGMTEQAHMYREELDSIQE
ncbi:MAG: glycosyltransferase family 2 protein [Lachnospiraceae bacterium]|nr:glycosyltransferase family 2 protein [Lachnospiraceae bacterium]